MEPRLPTDSRRPRPLPYEDLTRRDAISPEAPAFLVDLHRCIGCHACSVACKTAHDVPLGVFPLRVRWLPRPEGDGYAFVPVFSESLCGNDEESTSAGLDPACVRACPTDALRFGEREAIKVVSDANPLTAPDADDLKRHVQYRGLPDWVGEKLNRGAALDPRDEDPIYEQR